MNIYLVTKSVGYEGEAEPVIAFQTEWEAMKFCINCLAEDISDHYEIYKVDFKSSSNNTDVMQARKFIYGSEAYACISRKYKKDPIHIETEKGEMTKEEVFEMAKEKEKRKL